MSVIRDIQANIYRPLPSPVEGFNMVKSIVLGATAAGTLGYLFRHYVSGFTKHSSTQHALWYIGAAVIYNLSGMIDKKIFEGRYIEVIPTGQTVSGDQIEKSEGVIWQRHIQTIEEGTAQFADPQAEAKYYWKIIHFTPERIRSMSDRQILILDGRLQHEKALQEDETETNPENPAQLTVEARHIFLERKAKVFRKELLRVAYFALTYVPVMYLTYKTATALGCHDFLWETSKSNQSGIFLFTALKLSQLKTFLS